MALHRPVIESMEARCLLSVTALEFYAPIVVKGTRWSYSEQTSTGSITFVDTVAGPATFNGQTVTEVDIVATGFDSSTSATQTEMSTSYVGLTSAGFVSYGSVTGTDTTTFSPPRVSVPAALTAGQPVTTSDTQTVVSTNASGPPTTDVTSEQETFTLASDTPSSQTVPLGTFSAYEIDSTDTLTDQSAGSTPSTTKYTDDIADGMGFISGTSIGDGTAPAELTAFSTPSLKLVVTVPPRQTPAAETINSVSVAIEDPAGKVETGSNVAVTATLLPSLGATGTLSGATTVNAVNGIAKFSTLSVSSGGTYQLSFTDASNDTPVDSPFFKVDGFALKPVYVQSACAAGQSLPIAFSVQQVSLKGKPILTDNSTVVSLSVIGSAPANLISGSTNATMVNGLAQFTNIVFRYPGQFRFQATDSAGDRSVIFARVKVLGLNLKFVHMAAQEDVDLPINFAVYVVDAQKRVDSSFNGSVSLSLDVLPSRLGTAADHAGARLLGTTTVPVINGEGQYTATEDDNITDPGTYSLTATALDGSGLLPVGTIQPKRSAPVEVRPFKLVLLARPPLKVQTFQAIAFQVQMVTAEGDAIPTYLSFDSEVLPIGVDISSISPHPKTTDPLSTSAALFGNGSYIATFPLPSGVTGVPYFNTPGRYSLEISAVSPDTGIGETFTDLATPVKVGLIIVIPRTL